MEIEEQFRRDVRALLDDHALTADQFVARVTELMMNLLRVRAWGKLSKENLREGGD